MRKCLNLFVAIFFLATIGSANYVKAEGCIRAVFEEMNNGKCSFTGNCWPDADTTIPRDCDATAPNQGGGGSLPPGGGDDSLDPVNP